MITEDEDIGRRFKVGEVYIATPTLKGQPRKLGAIIGRSAATLQVAFIDEVATGKVRTLEGRDFAIVTTEIGQYNISACTRAAAKDAAIVNDILRHQQQRREV